jgi:hypothetical protein
MIRRNLICALIAIAPSLLAASPCAAGLLAELDLGINAFDLYGNASIQYEWPEQNVIDHETTSVSFRPMSTGHLFAAWRAKSWALGAEISTMKGGTRFKEKIVEGQALVTNAGAAVTGQRAGIRFQYMFTPPAEKWYPFAGAAAAYEQIEWDIGMAHAAVHSQEYVVPGLLGGSYFEAANHFLLGVYGRIDYHIPFGEREMVYVHNKGDHLTIVTSWIPLSLFFTLGASF